MKHPQTKGERNAARQAKIKAMAKHMKAMNKVTDQMGVPVPFEYGLVAKKAKHPKCPCDMCKRERSRDTRAAETRRFLCEILTSL